MSNGVGRFLVLRVCHPAESQEVFRKSAEIASNIRFAQQPMAIQTKPLGRHVTHPRSERRGLSKIESGHRHQIPVFHQGTDVIIEIWRLSGEKLV